VPGTRAAHGARTQRPSLVLKIITLPPSQKLQKKERVGEFNNPGAEWHAAGRAPKVNTYDFTSMGFRPQLRVVQRY
jgi:hypothetical protein